MEDNMLKSEMYALLGMKLDRAIQCFNYPVLNTDIFSPKDYTKIRTHLYKASTKDEKLGQDMIRILLKGKVEELKEKDEVILIGVQFDYKAESYIAELKLENYIWSFQSLHYVGEVARAKKMGIWLGSTVVAMLILLFSSFFLIQHFEKRTNAVLLEEANADIPSANQQNEPPANIESVPLTDLEQIAKKMDLVLIPEDEYQSLLEKKYSPSNETNIPHTEQTEAIQGESIEEPTKIVTITVQPGMKAYHVAQLLVENHLADDVEEIQDFFVQQNIQYRIRSGTHQIPTDADYMDIVEILTNRKKRG